MRRLGDPLREDAKVLVRPPPSPPRRCRAHSTPPSRRLAAACSKSDGSDPERTGPTKQAVERLHDFGLTTEQARCVVDEVGAASVVEATDLNALTDSQQYQDAAEACIDEE